MDTNDHADALRAHLDRLRPEWEARDAGSLIGLCADGGTVYLVLRHVSRSGMTRFIDPFVIVDGRPQYLRHVPGMRWDANRTGYRVNGCGMDMGLALVDQMMGAAARWFRRNGDPCGAFEALNGNGRWQDNVRHEWI